MYAWIWHRLPFGLWGKLTGSVLLATAAVALLWFVVFPWAEPLLPFDDVQVTQEAGTPADPGAPGAPRGGDAGVEESPGLDDHDLPYSTESNNPVPTSSGR
ncbi:MAG TPA: hypothetical protein VHN18_15305 [Micromonosporaceae bacterium]|nr:hypothetical protein [Micromonosporaceae bacterium]